MSHPEIPEPEYGLCSAARKPADQQFGSLLNPNRPLQVVAEGDWQPSPTALAREGFWPLAQSRTCEPSDPLAEAMVSAAAATQPQAATASSPSPGIAQTTLRCGNAGFKTIYDRR